MTGTCEMLEELSQQIDPHGHTLACSSIDIPKRVMGTWDDRRIFPANMYA